jgi:hypothetical protein
MQGPEYSTTLQDIMATLGATMPVSFPPHLVVLGFLPFTSISVVINLGVEDQALPGESSTSSRKKKPPRLSNGAKPAGSQSTKLVRGFRFSVL